MCWTPYTLSTKHTSSLNHTEIVPCGKCPECRAKRSKDWTFRLIQEQKVSSSSTFLTLTYDNEHVPTKFIKSDTIYRNGEIIALAKINSAQNLIPTLIKSDFQKFLKRLRKALKSDLLDPINSTPPKIKYYACGEYGTENDRPHYHAIMFNLPKKYLLDPTIIENIWQQGRIQIDECEPASIAYVTKYISKGTDNSTYINYNTGEYYEQARQREFSLMSKKMGTLYLTAQMQTYFKNNFTATITLAGGAKQILPRYFKEKIFTRAERKLLAAEAKQYIEDHPKYKNTQHMLTHIKDQFRRAEKIEKLNRAKL